MSGVEFGPTYELLRAGLAASLTARYAALPDPPAVYDAEVPGGATAPYVVLVPGSPGRPHVGFSRPAATLPVRAIAVHDSPALARALGDAVRNAVLALTLAGRIDIDLANGGRGDGVGDVHGGVAQWNEGFDLTIS